MNREAEESEKRTLGLESYDYVCRRMQYYIVFLVSIYEFYIIHSTLAPMNGLSIPIFFKVDLQNDGSRKTHHAKQSLA